MSFLWGKSETPKANANNKNTNTKRKPGANQPKRRNQVAPKPTKPELSEQQIYDNIEKIFFKDVKETHYDPVAEVLNTLSDEETATDLEKMIALRKAQLAVINSKLYAEVIGNYDKFVQGMVHIRELGVDLETTVNLCRNGRAMLKKADKELITAPINIIANNRKSILYGV